MRNMMKIARCSGAVKLRYISKPLASVPSTNSGATKKVEPARLASPLKSPGPLSGRPSMICAWRVLSSVFSSSMLRGRRAISRVSGLVGLLLPGAERVGRALRARSWDVLPEDDVGGFLHGELGTFDEIGEVSFEEGQSRAVHGTRQARDWRRAGQLGMQALKEVEALGIVRQTWGGGRRNGRHQRGVARPQQGSDQRVETPHLLGHVELRRNPAGLVAQPV